MNRYTPDKRTPEERRAEMESRRAAQQANALALMNDLHDKGFTGLLLDSTQVGGDSHYYCKVVIEDQEISHTRMVTLLAVAGVHGANAMLDTLFMNQQSFSRITLWPSQED